jgi:hypothetical protein
MTAATDGKALYYTAAGSVWAISGADAGDQPRRLVSGTAVSVDPNGLDLIVLRGETDAARLFRVPLSGASEHVIPFPNELRMGSGDISAPSVYKDGRILVDVDSLDSCWERPAIIDSRTGKVDRVNVPYAGDVWQPVWTPDGRILATGAQTRSALWRFRKATK